MIETPVFGHAAVAAPHDLAAQSGLSVLAQGGNAIEAMVAMAATIAVVYPHMNTIGGDGFWLIAGAAAARATPAFYRERGHHAIPAHGALAALTVPGTVSGWILALEAARALGGRLPLDLLLADAIRHAKDGFAVSPSQSRAEPRDLPELAEAPGFAIQFMTEGKFLPAGAPLRQTALAATLEQLAHAGLDDFYRGDVAREMAADLERAGSPLSREDFRRHRGRTSEPLSLAIQGVRLFNTPPPTQGLASLATLGLFERLGVIRAESFKHIHGLIEATKRAVALRDRVVTDPAFAREAPEPYLEAAFLDREAAMIPMREAAGSPRLSAAGDTAWLGAIDSQGIAVSFIQSVYWDFGSGLVLPGTGVLLQNRGVSFSLDPAALNLLVPGRRPFHTLNPAMALFDDGRVMPYGTMGGEAQPQVQAQLFSRYRLGQGLAEAIDAPRFVLGPRWGDGPVVLDLESRFEDSLIRALERAGHEIVVSDAYTDRHGHAGALVRHPRDGRIEAAHDPRADGGALGL